jgi:formylglycine-generating enzyme required for sulfatase activity
MPRLLCALLSLLAASSTSAVTMDWTFVGDPGNACNPGTAIGCRGTVAYGYFIGTYEVTNAQYAEFLNAKAASDPSGLYSTAMGTPASPNFGGITRSGVDGSYSYSAIAGRENMPVGWVSPYDAARFANWMHNGQGIGDTEAGAYTITIGSTGPTLTRSANAKFALPRDDEWYKAAFYDSGSASYFDYVTASNIQTVCAAPGPTPNTANCLNAVGSPTNVGSYTGSASPYGTFDQGGNVFEWSEHGGREAHTMYGGSFNETLVPMTAEFDNYYVFPFASDPSFGFRLVMIPEPSTGLLVIAGLLGLAGWRRKQH